jgi:hypothetical protein
MVHGYKYPWNISMNYYIEKHDMEIILDALELLHKTMKDRENFGLTNDYCYTSEDVNGLFQSFDNSGAENNV